MTEKNRKPVKTRVIEWLLTLGTVVVIIIAIICFAGFVDEYNYARNEPHKEDSFKYAAEEGDYFRMARYARENKVYGDNPKLHEYYALGDYYYAASMEKMYLTLDDSSLSGYWNNRRTEAASRTGSLSDHTTSIDTQLGVK